MLKGKTLNKPWGQRHYIKEPTFSVEWQNPFHQFYLLHSNQIHSRQLKIIFSPLQHTAQFLISVVSCTKIFVWPVRYDRIFNTEKLKQGCLNWTLTWSWANAFVLKWTEYSFSQLFSCSVQLKLHSQRARVYLIGSSDPVGSYLAKLTSPSFLFLAYRKKYHAIHLPDSALPLADTDYWSVSERVHIQRAG